MLVLWKRWVVPRTTCERVAEGSPASKIPSYPVLSGRWPRPLSASPPSPFFRWQRPKSGLKMRLNKNSVGWIKTVSYFADFAIDFSPILAAAPIMSDSMFSSAHL
ncbi:hypothetical protein N8I77_009257 [Diaporthe amygdali]|uniref:Uncharacterized protein n=1 Tax=Phomopsis amygdali TaxID=1214568 RepID=A0AAD9W0B6_PHOAM|nr:hypothetical protein N8I77_009257 [Diaporthe amygdali]